MSMKELEKRHKIALDAGFEIYHTGGGCLALRKDDGDHYWMITVNEDASIDGNPEEAEWVVGRYFESEHADAFRWILLEEPITLAQALSVYAKMPEPKNDEEVIKKWSDIGIEVPGLQASAPVPR